MLELLNARDRALDESMKGIFAAQPDEFVRLPGEYSYTLYRKRLKRDRVQIVISGGGGAGPLFPGFVADGLADAISHGDFGCAPNAYSLYEVGKAIHQGKGILYMTNNFAGDFLNNDMAQELLVTEGIPAKVAYASDDIFSAQGEPKEKRGGLSGIGLMMKAASGAADRGMGLDEVLAVA